MFARSLAIALTLTTAASAQVTWYVDDDAPGDPGPGDGTISDPLEDGTAAHPFDMVQEAVDSAAYGDLVLVLAGTYVSCIDFHGKGITLRSVDGAAETFIDGNGAGSVVSFVNGETSSTVLDGFTIQGGNATLGGGIYCANQSSPEILNNIVTANTAFDGGGIACVDSSPTIRNNLVLGNSCSNSGGGIFCYSSSRPTITNVTVTENSAAENGGGIRSEGHSHPVIKSSIVWGNAAGDGLEISEHTAMPIVDYCDVGGGWFSGTGNIDANPLFLRRPPYVYVLEQNPPQTDLGTSPCVNAGDSADPPHPGTTRADGIADEGVVDMGYHYPEGRIHGYSVFRNAGSNPASYNAMTRPVIGTDYIASIDLAGTTGHSVAVLAGYGSPLTFTLGWGQTGLVNPMGPELLGTPAETGPVATIAVPIPNDTGYVGYHVYTQAAHVGTVFPFALSNARDLVIGF